MTSNKRIILINFCAFSRVYVEGLEFDDATIDRLRSKYEILSDEELERESDWLDELSNK